MNPSFEPYPNEDPEPAIAYAYRPGHIYLNLTNRCTNACVFCSVRLHRGRLGPFNLNLAHLPAVPLRVHPSTLDHPWPSREESVAALDARADWMRRALASEPSPPQIMESLRPLLLREAPVREVVFCGCGEPLIRLEEVAAVSRILKGEGYRIRVNTNGHAPLMYGAEAARVLGGCVDAVSISLNAQDAAAYARLCRPAAGEQAFAAMLAFAEQCARTLEEVTLSAVGLDARLLPEGIEPPDLAACARLAAGMGAAFRVR